MKTTFKSILPVLLLLAFTVISKQCVFAQFQQKLTIHASGTMTYPDMLEDYTSYGSGFGLEGGLMYNYNRHFSFFANARFYYMFGSQSYSDAYYDNIAFGFGAKINMLPAKRINPYLFAEANLNLIWLEEYLYSGSDGFYDNAFGYSIGGLAGLGLDFRLNEHFVIFIQSGTYYTYWDNRLNLYSQAGVRINMFKSKTI